MLTHTPSHRAQGAFISSLFSHFQEWKGSSTLHHTSRVDMLTHTPPHRAQEMGSYPYPSQPQHAQLGVNSPMIFPYPRNGLSYPNIDNSARSRRLCTPSGSGPCMDLLSTIDCSGCNQRSPLQMFTLPRIGLSHPLSISPHTVGAYPRELV